METLAVRILTNQSILLKNSICPTRDLIGLINSNSEINKINLYRTTGSAELTWEWVNNNYTTSGTTTMTTKGKGKELNSGGEIKVLTWNEKGTYLAVGITNNKLDPPASTLIILSVHTGKSILLPIKIPTRSTLTHLSWHSLNDHEPDLILSSYVSKLILQLPSLPILTKSSNTSTSTSSAIGTTTATASGVFGSAKNAALLREREKEAGRTLVLSQSAPEFPTLLDCRKEGESSSKSSLLIVGDSNGQVHLYLGGSVFLGSIALHEDTEIVGASILPSHSPSTSTSTQISISLLLSNSNSLTSNQVELNLPTSLDILAEQSTRMKEALQHAFDALQEVKVLWDESRRIGKVWMARLDELGKFHSASIPATTQLLSLLLTGRHPRSLHDFLTAKINERGLNKWELATAAALEKLKAMVFKSLAPAVEHLVMYIEELKAWSLWPEKFGSFGLDHSELDRCIQLASEIIIASAEVETIALEEESCFQSFASWLHYELEKIALQEGSDVRPIARFQPIPVAHYIRHCLSSSPITQFLNFGPSLVSLEMNLELKSAREWFENLNGVKEGEQREGEDLMGMMKRMVEDLKGETDLSTVKSKNLISAPLEIDSTLESSDSSDQSGFNRTVTKSLPILLHLLAEKLGKGMKDAMETVGKSVVKKEGRNLSQGDGGRLWTGRIIEEVYYRAWMANKTLCFSQTSSNGIETFASSTQDEFTEILDFDFFDDIDLILLLKIIEQGATRYNLITVPLSTFSFSTSPPNTPLNPTRSHKLDAQFPPQTISMNGRSGRRFICVVGGEGRRLEVLEYADIGNDDEEEEEGSDGEEGMEE